MEGARGAVVLDKNSGGWRPYGPCHHSGGAAMARAERASRNASGQGRFAGTNPHSHRPKHDNSVRMATSSGWVSKMIAKLFGTAVPVHDPRLDEAIARFTAEVAKARATIARVSNDADALAELAQNIQAHADKIKDPR